MKFAADHPCGAGHFPGNPIIPGALLLDEVLALIGAHAGLDEGTWHIRSAKFPQPVRPGDEVHIYYTRTASGEIRFECDVSGSKVLAGIANRRIATESSSP